MISVLRSTREYSMDDEVDYRQMYKLFLLLIIRTL